MNWLSRLLWNNPRANSQVTMKGLIDNIFLNPPTSFSSNQQELVDAIRANFTQSGIDEIKEGLYSIEDRSLKSANAMESIRSAIMDSVDASVFNSALLEYNEEQLTVLNAKSESFSKSNILGVYLHSEFEILCLRIYSHSMYRDSGLRDWFSVYVEAASEYGKHSAAVVLASSGIFDGDPRLLATTQRIYEQTMPELRRRLLASPLGATFPNESAKIQ